MSTPRVASDVASGTTLRRRSKHLALQRTQLSKEEEMAQLAHELKFTTQRKREDLIKSLFKDEKTVRVKISPEQSLAMKTDLQLPWKKMRVMRRYSCTLTPCKALT